jgi:hypothetical protein
MGLPPDRDTRVAKERYPAPRGGNCSAEELNMLVAYDDGGFKITDIPPEQTPFPAHFTETLLLATKLQEWAKERQPGTRWIIVGSGPYSVRSA